MDKYKDDIEYEMFDDELDPFINYRPNMKT